MQRRQRVLMMLLQGRNPTRAPTSCWAVLPGCSAGPQHRRQQQKPPGTCSVGPGAVTALLAQITRVQCWAVVAVHGRPALHGREQDQRSKISLARLRWADLPAPICLLQWVSM